MELSRNTMDVLNVILKLGKNKSGIIFDPNTMSKLNQDVIENCITELNKQDFFTEYRSFDDGTFHIVLSDKALNFKTNNRMHLIKNIFEIIRK